MTTGAIPANPFTVENGTGDSLVGLLTCGIDAPAAIYEEYATIVGHEEETAESIGLVSDVVTTGHRTEIGNTGLGIGLRDNMPALQRSGLRARITEGRTTCSFTSSGRGRGRAKDIRQRRAHVVLCRSRHEYKRPLATLEQPADSAHQMANSRLRRSGITGRCHFHLGLVTRRLADDPRLLKCARRLTHVLSHDTDIKSYRNATGCDELKALNIAEVFADFVPACDCLLDAHVVGGERRLPLEFRLHGVVSESDGFRIGDGLLEHRNERLVTDAVVAAVGLNNTGALQRQADIVREAYVHLDNLGSLLHAEAPEILNNVLPAGQIKARQHGLQFCTRSGLPQFTETVNPIIVRSS